jgi:hypothetical protein
MRIETLKFVIQRFDNLYSASNRKGSFLLACNTFVCGGIFASYKELIDLLSSSCSSYIFVFKIVLLITIILAASSIVLICLAIIPYLKSGNSSKDNYHSMFFFGSVAEYTKNEYESTLSAKTDDEICSDLSYQACILAKGLRKKYNLLFWAGWIVPIQILLMMFMLTIVMFCSSTLVLF